jgi:Peptidase family M28
MASPPSQVRGGRAAEVAALLILALGVWLGFATAGLPAVVPASAPAATFSAVRAMRDLDVIAAAPHPVGTVAHDRLRDYLVDRLRELGCDDVHVQSATGFNTLDGPIAATVANIVGRRRGIHPGPALLLTAHYDAVPRSFGAGDDGAGVAAILETLRALANGPALDRDLIVVLSDAEEYGLLGAEAFVDLHPWAKDVGLVLNFEGRGDAGPVFMFQTSPGNASLIRALARGVAGARTNSLTGDVYRHLPSDTDLSIWLHSGFAVGALNFAHVGGYTHYHTPMDDLASLDPRVLQHMGDYALGMTRALGTTDVTARSTHDAIYFNAPLVGVVHYSARLALPLSVIAAIAVAVLISLRVRRRALFGGGVARSAVALLLTLALPALVTFLAWRLIGRLHPGYAEILQHDPYSSLWYLLAFSAFTVAIALEVQRRFAMRTTLLELAIAPLVLWALLGLVVAFSLPGASYLLIWPLLAGVLGVALLRESGESRQRSHPALALVAIPALVLWPPLIKSLEVALTANSLAFCALLAALVMSVLVVPLHSLGWLRRWMTIAAALTAAGALVAAEATAGFTAMRKRPDSLAYLIDADSGRAWWVSFDRAPDEWTARALGTHPVRRTFADNRLTLGGETVLASDATPVAAAAAPIRIVATEPVPGGRRVHLHVAQSGDAEELALSADGTTTITNVTINGRSLPDGREDRYRAQYRMGTRGMILRYFGVPEDGVDLWFTIHSPAPALFRLATIVAGLPSTAREPLPPRPPFLMSKPFISTDMTMIEHTLRL